MSDTKYTPCFGRSELFFGENGKGNGEAKKLCRSCPAAARAKCLELALAFEKPGEERHGVWGGLSVHERNVKFGRRAA